MRLKSLITGMRPIWRTHEDPDAAKRLSRLRRGFHTVSRGWDRAIRRRMFYRAAALWLVGAVGAFAVTWYFLNSPWPIVPTLKHLAAFPNCDAARLVGLAPSLEGPAGILVPSRSGQRRHLVRAMAKRPMIICEAAMPRTYLIFGDIEGKLDVLRVECHQMRPQGPLSRPQTDREVRPHEQPDEMARDAKRRLPEA